MHLSPNDSNQYRYLTLSNGLRVLLIHSDTAQQSAAALAVNVGHFDDPVDRQGLAHYLEHMLFWVRKNTLKWASFKVILANMVERITRGQERSTPASF